MATCHAPWKVSVRYASLLVMIVQQVACVVLVRYSKQRTGSEELYLASTVVFASECLKLFLNLGLEYIVNRKTIKGIWLDVTNADSKLLAVPAFLYLVQNNLFFVALGNLSVPVYQVTNQGKLLTTALFSRLLLGRHISSMQYCSLAVLAVGVALVQLSGMEEKQGSPNENNLIGLTAVGVSSLTSGYAGVFFEKMIKSSEESSVYIRNIQLSSWSVVLGFLSVIIKDFKAVQSRGFFHGYNLAVAVVICSQAISSLLIALVLKYADAVLKGIAMSVAAVLSAMLSIIIWDMRFDSVFVAGSVLVFWSVWQYICVPRPYSVKSFMCYCPIGYRSFPLLLLAAGLASTLLMLATFTATIPNWEDSRTISDQKDVCIVGNGPLFESDRHEINDTCRKVIRFNHMPDFRSGEKVDQLYARANKYDYWGLPFDNRKISPFLEEVPEIVLLGNPVGKKWKAKLESKLDSDIFRKITRLIDHKSREPLCHLLLEKSGEAEINGPPSSGTLAILLEVQANQDRKVKSSVHVYGMNWGNGIGDGREGHPWAVELMAMQKMNATKEIAVHPTASQQYRSID